MDLPKGRPSRRSTLAPCPEASSAAVIHHPVVVPPSALVHLLLSPLSSTVLSPLRHFPYPSGIPFIFSISVTSSARR